MPRDSSFYELREIMFIHKDKGIKIIRRILAWSRKWFGYQGNELSAVGEDSKRIRMADR